MLSYIRLQNFSVLLQACHTMYNGAHSTLAFAASAFNSVPSKRLSISAQIIKSE